MRRRLLLGFGILALLIVGGVSAYWYVAAQRVSEDVRAWMQARRAEGWTVSASGQTLGGWPRAASVVVAQVSIAGGEPDLPGGVSWRADRVLLRLDLLHPDRLDVLAEGEQRIGRLLGAAVAYTTALTRLRVPLRPPGGTAELTVRSLRAVADGMTVDAAQALLAADTGAEKAQAALRVTLVAHDITLPAGVDWPLGRHVPSVSADVAIDGPLPPPRGLAPDARAWRDGGGAIDLRRIELRWGPLDGWLSGTVSLDSNLQPQASGTARASNYAQTLDILAARRVVGVDAALAAKAVLSLLASVPASGPAQVELPFTIHDQIVAVRGIPLLRLPLLRWPD